MYIFEMFHMLQNEYFRVIRTVYLCEFLTCVTLLKNTWQENQRDAQGHSIHQSPVCFTEGCWCFLFPLNEKSKMMRVRSWVTQSNS